MAIDMNLLDGILQRDKDNFVRICNRLLSTCFLCKGNVTARSDYYFVLKHKAEMEENVLNIRQEQPADSEGNNEKYVWHRCRHDGNNPLFTIERTFAIL